MKPRRLTGLLKWQARLSLPAAHRLGRFLGRLLWWLPNRSRRITLRNLELCFPSWRKTQRRRLARQSLAQLGCALMEAGPLWSWPVDRLVAQVTEVRGKDLFVDGVKAGDGLILLAPHLGAWEILIHWCLRQGPAAVLYRPPKDPALEELVTRARARSGAEMVRADLAGVRRLYQLVKEGVPIGILPDQQPKQGEGQFARFFGQSALTMVLAARLAARQHPRILTGWAERLDRGAGYRIHFSRLPTAMDSGELERDLAAMNQAVETAVRTCPAQYQWNYKRFSIQPDGAPSPYR